MKNEDIDRWVDEIYSEGQQNAVYRYVEMNPFKPYIYAFQAIGENKFVEINVSGYQPFYAFFQPCFKRKAPLVVHTPGYGGEMCIHPELSYNFHVLHINPLGYTTPDGKDESKLTMNGLGSVLPDTITGGERSGYFKWLANCVMAIKWAFSDERVIADRISFFGTSQGGGASLLLGSIFSGRGTCCVVADQSFMTNFRLANFRGAYAMAEQFTGDIGRESILNATEYIDTVNHVHRYKFPTLLISGGNDDSCPPDTVYDLFMRLKCTKSYTHFNYLTHGYNKESLVMAKAWFTMYA